MLNLTKNDKKILTAVDKVMNKLLTYLEPPLCEIIWIDKDTKGLIFNLI